MDPKKRNKHASSPKALKGYEPSRYDELYLENVHMEPGISDKQLGSMVKKCGTKSDVQVLSVRVVKNRFCDDVVGCKIKIPVTCIQKALAPGAWPSYVRCRRWEERPRRDNVRPVMSLQFSGRDRRNNGTSNKSRDRLRDHINHWSDWRSLDGDLDSWGPGLRERLDA